MGTPIDMGGNILVVDSIEISNSGVGTAGQKPSIRAGSGAPSGSAPKGSIWIRTDGSSTSTRMYVNTDGSTTWTNFTSAA